MGEDLDRIASQLRLLLNTSDRFQFHRRPSSQKERIATLTAWVEQAFSNQVHRLRFESERAPATRFVEQNFGSLRVQMLEELDVGADITSDAFAHTSSLVFQLSGKSGVRLKHRPTQEFIAGPGDIVMMSEAEDELRFFRGEVLRVRLTVSNLAVRNKLEGLLHRAVPNLEFARSVSLGHANLGLLLEYLVVATRYLCSEPLLGDVGLPWRTELEQTILAQIALQMPHSQSHLLLHPTAAAAPRNVRRAEAFMYAHVSEPLSIEQIARAAGCSPRALQKAFVRFRGVTPHSHLRRIRYELARERLLNGDVASVAVLAHELGFSNPGRFASEFKKMFGRSPAHLLKFR